MKMMFLTLTLLTPACAAHTQLFKITPVSTVADSIKCAQAGGHAGMIADLDAEGNPSSGWVAGCILPVK